MLSISFQYEKDGCSQENSKGKNELSCPFCYHLESLDYDLIAYNVHNFEKSNDSKLILNNLQKPLNNATTIDQRYLKKTSKTTFLLGFRKV